MIFNLLISQVYFTNAHYLTQLKACPLKNSSSQSLESYILESLPETLEVFPSENYYYFQIPVCGKIYKGNLRTLFYYGKIKQVYLVYESYKNISIYELLKDTFEIVLFPSENTKLKTYKLTENLWKIVLNNDRKLNITKFIVYIDPPHRIYNLPSTTKFVFNTIDESGISFSLAYDTTINNFIWFLNDSQLIPISLKKLQNELYIEPISGFVFLKVTDNEIIYYILIGVPVINIIENNWWDGPFDQLNDRNWNLELRKYVVKSLPELDTLINEYLYYNHSKYGRVAISNYFKYTTIEEIINILEKYIQLNSEEPVTYIKVLDIFRELKLK